VFCETEVKPFVEKAGGITLPDEPEGRAAMGGSSGGCAAFTMAWCRPDLFRKVLTYSGTYVNQQYPFNPQYPTGCWEYHAGQELIAMSEKKPLKVHDTYLTYPSLHLSRATIPTQPWRLPLR
jgi:iron(III)-enterobactin esterase